MSSIGVPREIKSGEARVGLTPREVQYLVSDGHRVLVQSSAGTLAGYGDQAYRDAGATLVASASDVYRCDLVAKVKEIQPAEFALLQRGQVICGFAQVARDAALLDALLVAGVTVVAYEAIVDDTGRTPVLAPMSDIAGRMSASIAQWCMQTAQGGRGMLVDSSCRVLIVGAGVAGLAAAEAFYRAGCGVTVLVRDRARARLLQRRVADGVLCAATDSLSALLPQTDVLVGCVSVRGTLSPKLVTRSMLSSMGHGAVFIDVGIDMGGIAETSRQTGWSAPVYVEEGVVHFCVPNIPAQAPRAATAALAAAALPYVREIAGNGLLPAARRDVGLAAGIQLHDGRVTSATVAADTGRAAGQLFP
jgi:alanine dehydrogenase